MSWQNGTDYADEHYAGTIDQLLTDLDILMAENRDPRKLFQAFTRILLQQFEINKGFLALREGDQTRFLAVASWNHGKIRKNLSLRMPTANSLFEKVVESGQIYSDNFAQLFNGNLIERRLLIDDETASLMLRPLKHEARVVGLIGYSSDISEAFIAFEEGLLNPAFERLGTLLGEFQPELTEV